MNELSTLEPELKKITAANFEALAIKIFNQQYLQNDLYQKYCTILQINPSSIVRIEQIPFLPIQFFKTKTIKTTAFEEELIFESSGTTGSINSKHFVKDKAIYEASYLAGFRNFYGNEKDYCIIGLLPSYLERQHSSLVYMVNDLIEKSGHKNSGFYLYDYEKLQSVLQENENAKQKTILIGVTYALLDFAEQYPTKLEHTIIMETGGMKGRREELTRSQVHQKLSTSFAVENIHSEYGMTELLSQAYSTENGIFTCSKSMKVFIRSEDDPLLILQNSDKDFITGAINIVDLSNLYSCSFIATDDAGKLFKNGNFEILGRLENSDIRGCGLMITD
jgi:phenylacetate-coenzyme A ligase PaaK-like adenylate-forming protein